MNPTRLSFAALLTLAACATSHDTESGHVVAPPMQMQGSAFDAAGQVEITKSEPQQFDGLHNLFRLSDNISSGSEPEGEAAFAKLQAMGIKTILSVDGKAPDAALAKKHGMRYVHVPIRYRGITRQERLEIVKTFRELEAPFYVHCFHGRHRGPAATALGRIVLDKVSRGEAIAEMRQYFGTSEKYEGLYSTIALKEIPDAQATQACDFDFAAAHRFKGFRQAMVDITRSFGTTEKLAKTGWKATDDHPDANALNESRRTTESFRQALELEELSRRPESFRQLMQISAEDSEKLTELLAKHAKGSQESGALAKTVLKKLKADCKSCHARYRNAGY